MTKGEKVVQRYNMGESLCKHKIGHGHEQRRNNIGQKRRITILGQEKHTSRGSKLMNFD